MSQILQQYKTVLGFGVRASKAELHPRPVKSTDKMHAVINPALVTVTSPGLTLSPCACFDCEDRLSSRLKVNRVGQSLNSASPPQRRTSCTAFWAKHPLSSRLIATRCKQQQQQQHPLATTPSNVYPVPASVDATTRYATTKARRIHIEYCYVQIHHHQRPQQQQQRFASSTSSSTQQRQHQHVHDTTTGISLKCRRNHHITDSEKRGLLLTSSTNVIFSYDRYHAPSMFRTSPYFGC